MCATYRLGVHRVDDLNTLQLVQAGSADDAYKNRGTIPLGLRFNLRHAHGSIWTRVPSVEARGTRLRCISTKPADHAMARASQPVSLAQELRTDEAAAYEQANVHAYVVGAEKACTM